MNNENRFLKFYVSLRRIDFFNLFTFFFIIILLLTSIKEFEFCKNNYTSNEYISQVRSGPYSAAKQIADREESEEAAVPLQGHPFCHQNHMCQLIFSVEANVALNLGDKKAQEIFLFPPKDLFLEGPFKPPKQVVKFFLLEIEYMNFII